MSERQRAAPSIAIGARIPIASDELRRELQARLGLNVAELIQRSMQALVRELDQAGSRRNNSG